MKVMQIIKTSLASVWAYRQVRCLTEMGVEVVVVLPNDTETMALRYKNLPVTIELADLTLPLTKPHLLKARMQKLRDLSNQYSAYFPSTGTSAFGKPLGSHSGDLACR